MITQSLPEPALGYPLGSIPSLGQGALIRIDITIHIANTPHPGPPQLPVQILLPAELAERNGGRATFWFVGLNQQIPPAILAWLRHHPHYSTYLSQELSHAT